jgi:hypothetical protein
LFEWANWLGAAARWADGIPEAIWSGVVGATVALIGVFFVNSSNTKRLRLQLAHDAEQKERDRLAALRRDVYLQAPKEAVRAIKYLASLPRRDLSKIETDKGISGFAAISAQIGVISDLATAEATVRLGNLMAKELNLALGGLSVIQSNRVNIELGQERLDVVYQDIDRIQAEKQNLFETGNEDAVRHRTLSYYLDARIEERDKLFATLSKLGQAQQRLIFDWQKAFLDRLPALAKLNIGVMRAIRKEIGLVHELDEYEAQMTRLADDLRAETVSLMQGWVDEAEDEGEVTAATPRPAPEQSPGG